MRWAIISSAWSWPMTRWLSVSASLSTVSISFLTMRPTGMPVQSCDDRGDRLLVDARQDQRRLALQRPTASSCSSASSASNVGALLRRRPARRPAHRDRRRGRLLRLRAACLELAAGAFDRLAALRAAARESRGSRSTSSFSAFQRASSVRASVCVSSASFSSRRLSRRSSASTPTASSRPMISSSVSQRLDACGGSPRPAAGTRVLADGDARAGGVEQAHRLVRQLARRDVAVRQPHRRLERLVEHLHAVMLLERRGDAAHHQDAPCPRSARRPSRPGSAA